MNKKIAILGSTGSIGQTLLRSLKKKKKNFSLEILSAHKNYKLLFKQAILFNVKNLIITDKQSYTRLIALNKKKNKKIKIYNSFNSIPFILKSKINYAMSAITGLNGLDPTLKIIPYTNRIAIANKEAIICGWNLIKKSLKKNNTEFIPVDSEHFSIWYAIKENDDAIEKIYLTASGGPFYKLNIKKFNKIKIKDALNHPNWQMGNKITIDSATMMNKVFEIIEAKKIFNIPYKKLSILVHPKSYIHAIVVFKNGMIKIIAHETDMRIPILNSLNMKYEKEKNSTKLDIKTLNNLSFNSIDVKRYPVTKILKKIPERDSMFETLIVSVNDELVDLFLKKKIEFTDICSYLSKFINSKEFKKYKNKKPINLKNILKFDKKIRLKIKLNFQ